jgi:hypothetical protein
VQVINQVSNQCYDTIIYQGQDYYICFHITAPVQKLEHDLSYESKIEKKMLVLYKLPTNTKYIKIHLVQCKLFISSAELISTAI